MIRVHEFVQGGAMSKMLVIERCQDCLSRAQDQKWRYFCGYPDCGKLISSLATIPEWCPLPDYVAPKEPK